MQTKVSVVGAVALTANQWELYTCSKKCGTAARKLNAGATKAIKAANKLYAATRNQRDAEKAAWALWNATSEPLSEFGACDSEPRWHFEDLLCVYFHQPNGLTY